MADRTACDTCVCTARYTTAQGKRSCALCCMDVPAVRDIDIPALVDLTTQLLDDLDTQHVSAGYDLRQRIRGMIGRRRKQT